MRCSEPGHRAPVASVPPRGPGRWVVGRKMVMSRKTVIITVGIGLAGLCLIAGIRHHKSSAIDDHISALARLRYPPTPTGLHGYFSTEYLLWNVQGRLN